MIKIRRQGDPGCYLCGQPENCDLSVFFEYPITKVVWCVVVICFHQSTRPANYDQFWTWITKALPGGDTYICWDLLQYVGQYGRPGTKFSLRKNI
jgi:hypothetical protein